jgi:hypothetical protein
VLTKIIIVNSVLSYTVFKRDTCGDNIKIEPLSRQNLYSILVVSTLLATDIDVYLQRLLTTPLEKHLRDKTYNDMYSREIVPNQAYFYLTGLRRVLQSAFGTVATIVKLFAFNTAT